MLKTEGSLIQLPRKGKAMVVTDLHGDLNHFNQYLDIWEEFKDNNNHFILTGDFIHGIEPAHDFSVEIVEEVKYHFKHTPNFHVLLGNHEWSHITGRPVYKASHNQKNAFEDLVMDKCGDKWVKKLSEYTSFFATLKIAVKTDNGVFITHAGPSVTVMNLDEVINIIENGYYYNLRLEEMLWDRYGDYRLNDMERLLKRLKCKVSLVGHTMVDGYQLIGDKQMILCSSNFMGRSAYLELDLEKEIDNAHDLEDMIRYI
jgi:serine/threonine-protein phosphatase PP1 catalytic subunit